MIYIYNINSKFLLVLFTLLSVMACSDDDLPGLEPLEKPTATTNISSLTLNEGFSDVIPFTISSSINKVSQFKIEVVSGSATEDIDFTAGPLKTDADTGIPGKGYEITVPAFADSFEIPVSALADELVEGTETVKLKISAAGVRTIITPRNYIVTLTINNFDCTPNAGIPSDAFVGDYAIADVDARLGPANGSANFGAGTVTLTVDPTNPNSRIFAANILPGIVMGTRNVSITFLPGDNLVSIGNVRTNISCDGVLEYFYSPAPLTDSSPWEICSGDPIIINYVEDSDGSCGGPFLSSFSLTKI